MTKTDAFGDAWTYSMEYQLRYFIAGFLAIPLIMVLFKCDLAAAAAMAMLHSHVAAILTFPGSMIVNYLALRMGRSPQPGKRRRAWTSAAVAVFLAWSGYSVLQDVPCPLPNSLVRNLGEGLTMMLSITGCTLLSSTVGVIVGWALSPWKKAGKIV